MNFLESQAFFPTSENKNGGNNPEGVESIRSGQGPVEQASFLLQALKG